MVSHAWSAKSGEKRLHKTPQDAVKIANFSDFQKKHPKKHGYQKKQMGLKIVNPENNHLTENSYERTVWRVEST